MPKRKRVKRATKKESNKMLLIAIVVIAIVVMVAAILFMPQEQTIPNETPTPVQKEPAPVEITSGDVCTSNLQCFSASCKSTPSIVDCVNSTHQETYYKNCRSYVDINIAQDFSKCSCVQDKCTAVR